MKKTRINKWLKDYVVQGNYGYGHGWEDVTAEETYGEARQRLREYRDNSPGAHRLITRRFLNPDYTRQEEQKQVDALFNVPIAVYSAKRGPL